jgi:hypothetical protein
METSNILAAISDAKRERETLAAKLSDLDAFIAQGELLLTSNTGQRRTDSLFPIPRKETRKVHRPKKARRSRKDAIWIRAQTVLEETGNTPMKASELLQEFRKRNWKLSEKNGKEILRYSLRHKPDIFVHDTEAFTYSLKKFPVE